MNMIRLIALVALATIITACDVIDYLIITDTNTRPIVEPVPPDLYYVNGDAISLIDQGSYCWTSDGRGICADMMLPSYEEDQYILLSSNSIELLFFEPIPDSVRIGIRGHEWTMSIEYLAEAELLEDGRVLVTLPDNDLQGRYILFISAVWENHGDAFYTMPILLEQ